MAGDGGRGNRALVGAADGVDAAEGRVDEGDTAVDGDAAVDPAVDREAPQLVAGRRVQRVDRVVAVTEGVQHAIGDCDVADDTAELRLPALRPVRGVEGIDGASCATRVAHPVEHRRGEQRLIAFPVKLARLGVEGVEVTLCAVRGSADVGDALGDHRCRRELVAGVAAPQQRPGRRVDGEETRVVTADVGDPIGERRVVCCALRADLKAPPLGARRRVETEQEAIARPDHQQSVVHDRRRTAGTAACQRSCPVATSRARRTSASLT